MKTRRMILPTIAAAVALVSCSPKPGDITKITGVVNDSTVTTLRLALPSLKLDTTLTVTDGRFYVEVPAAVESYGLIMNQKYGTYFISDGTEMEMTFEDGEIKVKTVPEYIESGYAAYVDELTRINNSNSPTYKEEIEALIFKTMNENPDNGVAVQLVYDGMYLLSAEKMLELIALVQEPVAGDDFIASRKAEAEAQLKTSPGMMFTDFTVEHVYGYDRSMNPQPLKKEVKFSDYVGKGKYVLVDFWAPWCGPCRREIPNIRKVYDEYKDKGLEVLSISVWERKPQSHTIEVAAELGMDWHHINNAQSVPTRIYGIGGIPHLMLIGPDGTILSRGFHGAEGIEAAVAEHLK